MTSKNLYIFLGLAALWISNTSCKEHNACNHVQPDEDDGQGHRIIYPVVVNKDKSSLNKLDSAARHLVIKFIYEGARHKLKVEYNGELLSKANKLRDIFTNKAKSVYYQGYCSTARLPKSSIVSLTIRNGIRGVIKMDGSSYHIRPYQSSNSSSACQPHLIYKRIESRETLCGNESGQWTSIDKIYGIDPYRVYYHGIDVHTRLKRSSETKYLELALVLDSSMMAVLGNDEDYATEFILQLTNMVDMYYQSLNVRVGLVNWSFWDVDQITASSNQKLTLQRFLRYTQTQFANRQYDVIHLISGQRFDGNSSGMSIPDSICTSRAIAVLSSPSNDYQHLASVLSHMIGHNLGLNHDTTDCSCADPQSGCIMSDNLATKNPIKFSSCSYSRMELLSNVGFGHCLVDEPIASSQYPQHCGNGFVERGEECDCGPAANCTKKDPCCDPTTCLLKSWAQCSSGPCCHECLAKPTNQLCRPSSSECDSPEYCDGLTGSCPADIRIRDYEPCSSGEGYCYQGKCPTRDSQCHSYWGDNSKSAHPECYTYNNIIGSLFGHCGFDLNGSPIKCSLSDSFCGLLQCEGGLSAPLNLGFRTTSAGVNGNEQYKCKIVTSGKTEDIDNVGLVSDGTKCGDGKICSGYQCIDIPTANTSTCPTSNNISCSGHGRCTNLGTCSCDPGYQGLLCNQVLPSYRPEITDATSTSGDLGNSGSGSLETKWLIVIVCIVAVMIILALMLAFFFCRNRVATPKKAPRKSHIDESYGSDVGKDRTISFGQTPSYRNEKNGKRKKLRKKKHSFSSAEESDSDEHKITNITIPIPEELSRQPEKGILKNASATYGIQVDDECYSSNCSCSDNGSCSCSEQEMTVEIHEKTVSSGPRESDDEIVPPPPLEFNTEFFNSTDFHESNKGTSGDQDSSPTGSEDMRYCATEADQFYGQYLPLNRQPHPVHQQGGDSATDSAIDMPGDGSISTINEIPPSSQATLNGTFNRYNTLSPSEHINKQTDDLNISMERPFGSFGSKHKLIKLPRPDDHLVQPVIYESQRLNPLASFLNQESPCEQYGGQEDHDNMAKNADHHNHSKNCISGVTV